ncbi:type II toxin-antitoxin system HicB family antitoxin [Acinetobacter dispersus]|uniref:HicB-like antitoxin of toxin-antitoxin system domain-containing protein n=1 Tax=Acinetobacter dispersus TaxID=70348 RepID=N9LAP3_9GAMM|nr:type II toxin-antitoxin system HicB family antitoxin [Acinetobacter dispersus]ENW93358.1 hypothetical protein F904_01482 [Acinetobacter dispersus]
MLYPIAIERGSDTEAFGVIVPDIAGCHGTGDTLEEALDSIKEAISGHLEILAEDGEDIPVASPLSKYMDLPEYSGMVWAVTEVDVSRYLGSPEKINVTLPSRLIRKIDDSVGKDKQYKTRSAFLAAGAERLLHA